MARTAGTRSRKATVIFQRYYVVKSRTSFSQRGVGNTAFTFRKENALLSQKKKQQIMELIRPCCHSSRNDEKNVLITDSNNKRETVLSSEKQDTSTFVKRIVSNHDTTNRITSMTMIDCKNTRPTIPSNKMFSLMMKQVGLVTTKFRTTRILHRPEHCSDVHFNVGATAEKKYDDLVTKTTKTSSMNPRNGNGTSDTTTTSSLLEQRRSESSSFIVSPSSSPSFCTTPALRGIYQTPSGKWKTKLIHHQGRNKQCNMNDGFFETRERAALAYEMAREQIFKDACPIRIKHCITILLETLNSTTTTTTTTTTTSDKSDDNDDDGSYSLDQCTTTKTETSDKSAEAATAAVAADAPEIYFHKSSGKWEANLDHREDKQKYYIGIFETREQASFFAYERAPKQFII